jgi:hypothetical protein
MRSNWQMKCGLNKENMETNTHENGTSQKNLLYPVVSDDDET